MRPIYLKMKAFGSFAEEKEIDFDAFGNGLYLIAGDTGAGKTTIFDAIMFALYGSASGNLREPGMMHSDFVSKSVDTEVTFTFEHAGVRSVVNRSLHFPKIRGKENEYGEAKQEAILTEGSRLPIKNASVVTQRITELLNMDAEQFRKIVMLAQGEFRKFLEDDTKGRSDILSRLFDSTQFVAFQNRLTVAEKQLHKMRREDSDKRRVVMTEMFRCPENGLEEDVALYAPEHPALEDNLTALVAWDEREKTTAQEEKQKAEKQCGELELQRNAAEEHNKQLDAKDAAEQERIQLQEQAGAMEILQCGIGTLEKAWRQVHPTVLRLLEKQTELRTLQESIAALETDLAKKRENVISKETIVVNDEEKQKRADTLQNNTEELKRQLPKYQRLAEERGKLQEASRIADIKRAEGDRIHGQIEKAEEAQKKRNERLEQLQNAERDASEAAHAEERAQELLNGLTVGTNSLLNCVAGLTDLQKKVVSEKQALETARVKAYSALEHHNDIYRRYISGQAGVLAGTLEETIRVQGKGCCPVCGTEFRVGHKQHFAVSTADVPDQKKLDEAKDAMDTARKDCEDQARQVQRLEERVELGKQTVEQIVQRLYGETLTWEEICAPAFLSVRVSDARAALERKQNQTKRLSDAVKEKDKLTAEQKNAAEQIDVARNALENTEKARAAAETEKAVVQSSLNELCVGLTFADEASAKKEILRLQKEQANLQKEIDDHRKALEQAKVDVGKAEGALMTARDSLPNVEAAVEEAEAEREAKLKAANISEEQYEAEISRLNGSDGEHRIAEQKGILENWERSVSNNEGRLKQLKELTAGWRRVDLSVLEEQLREAYDTRKQAGERATEVENRYANHSDCLKLVKTANANLARTEKAYKRLHLLANQAAGMENAEGGKLSFERYAMGAIFRDVLERANVRLETMSGGTYELIHDPNGGKTKSSQAGLDIEVLDHSNGGHRKTGSFSGGESFLVSLALALGLSDVVQSRAGGSAMESMFIDEGFGSLSDNALENAIRVLEELAGSNRQIGIISHVDKLDECLTKKIRVTKGEKGSSLKFEL